MIIASQRNSYFKLSFLLLLVSEMIGRSASVRFPLLADPAVLAVENGPAIATCLAYAAAVFVGPLYLERRVTWRGFRAIQTSQRVTAIDDEVKRDSWKDCLFERRLCSLSLMWW